MSTQLAINSCVFTLSESALRESKILDFYVQQGNTKIELNHPKFSITNEDIVSFVDYLNSGNLVMNDRLFVTKFILENLICSNLIKKFNSFIDDNLEELRKKHISVILCNPEKIWDLTDDEVSRLLPLIDNGLITETDVFRHTLSKDYKNGECIEANNK